MTAPTGPTRARAPLPRHRRLVGHRPGRGRAAGRRRLGGHGRSSGATRRPPGTQVVVGDAASTADLERPSRRGHGPDGRAPRPGVRGRRAAVGALGRRRPLGGCAPGRPDGALRRGAPRLAGSGRRVAGSVVLVGSIVGAAEGSGRSPAYAAAKAGLEGLARSLAVIGGPDGVRVNVVAPGAIDTPFDTAGVPRRCPTGRAARAAWARPTRSPRSWRCCCRRTRPT